MKATLPLSTRGFLSRSVEELKRLSGIAMRLDGVKGLARPRQLYCFHNDAEVKSCVLMSDRLIGGKSKTHLDFSREVMSTQPGFARFHGSISTSLPSERPNIERSGYAAFRTPDQLPTVFGRSVWDIDPYSYLALRVKSDGRAYFINVQTETVEPTDLHQHRLFVKHPGQWETIFIKWNDFVRTNHGFVVEPQTELLRQKVKSVGVGLTDRVEGPFELCIERIWATNTMDPDESSTSGSVLDDKMAPLKNRKGETIRW